VPLVKDKSTVINSVDNYRPITLIPIISKVFESVMLTLREDLLLCSLGLREVLDVLAYLLVLPGSRARIVRCGGRYDPQLVKRSSE